ncbi:hypothetical protein ATANTOWER_030067 [Ataeniobius toweri]|uniref:Uncharacterized protein n=1 Tax=Ataeniobius toweri TaxID=208326 RepID=A0ABU7C7Z8_9TELE|nr:hypothetical protein [Ataeniobius toweri]
MKKDGMYTLELAADVETKEKGQELKRLREGTSSHPPVNSYTEQSFSAEQLNPEVLKSFESLWKSVTPSDFSQLFLAHVPGKKELCIEPTSQGNGQTSSDGQKTK